MSFTSMNNRIYVLAFLLQVAYGWPHLLVLMSLASSLSGTRSLLALR